MNKFSVKGLFIGSLFVVFFFLGISQVKGITSGVDFNSTSDLTDNFNNDGSPQFTNQAAGGINGTGSVNVPIPSNDLWVTKEAYTVSGAAGSVYTFSAYFKVAQNSGYGNLGFTNASSGTPDFIGQPSVGIGANFHGGGGAFVNNGSQTSLNWPPDLVLGNWYWMTFEVTTKGSNTFDLKLQIWNTDSTGAIGTMKTEKTLNNVVNTEMGSATIIHGFFSAAGSRMDTIDNFEMDLQGATFIAEGEPVVISNDEVVNITSNSAQFGGNVTDENGGSVTAKGVCWSTSANPTLADNCTTNGSGTGSFTSNLTGLSASTTYYVRAYATNSNGTSYGTEESFTTLASGSADSDGIDNSVEDNAPNSGDANNDGTPDSEQNNVGSIVNSVSGNYVVLETSGTCTTIDEMSMSAESDLTADTSYSYPDGLMNFTLSGCTVGGTVDITQYYYGVNETDSLVLRKYNSGSSSYSTIDDASVQIVTIDGEQVVKVDYSITDGGSLDADSTANGEIVDPAGLGIATAGVPDTSGFYWEENSNVKNLILLNIIVTLAFTALGGWYYYDQYWQQT